MRQADYPRAINRARTNDLFNGGPPWTLREAEENEVNVNVNELSGVVAAHDARAQFYNGFLKPGYYFRSTTDYGPKHKVSDWGKIRSFEMNRIMKRKLKYTEHFRSRIALDVLHGIAPGGWRNEYEWCPQPYGVEDVLIPGNTIIAQMDDMPFFPVYRSMTGPELIKLTRGPRRDPAWNMKLVNACLEWIDKQTLDMVGNNWPEIWAPEKMAERVKSDGGFYCGDDVPTIDVWDFYFWNDENKVQGWNRRIILDAWSQPGIDITATNSSLSRPSPSIRKTGKPWQNHFKGQFLYNPGKRKWASCLPEMITWQFADLSPVAPFRYHSVRSLGMLLYSVCHLQNRLYCKFTEAQFEQLLMYFRVKGDQDMQRALKVDLVHRGFIDESVQFIPAAERYQIRADLIELGLQTNQNIIGRNSASFTSQPGNTQDNRDLTATQWMGESNKVTQLVASALNQAYIYQTIEYREIARRFSLKNSKDPDVMTYQANCLKKGIDPKVLYNADAWEIEPERVMGAGNKTLEMAVADRLMAIKNQFDPEPQRVILRDYVLATTDNPSKATQLVPEQPHITDTIHDAQLAAGALMQGLPVAVKSGQNHIEVVEALMVSMAVKIQEITKRDNMGTMEELVGLQNMAKHIQEHIAIIAQDPNEKQRVKKYGDQIGELMNLVKGFAQRLQEKMEKEQQGNGGDPELQAKLQAAKVMADAKAANTRESHAQRTAQRQLQFEQKFQQDQAKSSQQLQTEAARSQLDITAEAKRQELDIVSQARKAQIELEKEELKIKKQQESANKKKKAE